MQKNLNKIKVFLSAKTKLGLMDKMRANNTLNDTMFGYDAPIWDGSEWVVWFTADITKLKNPRGNI